MVQNQLSQQLMDKYQLLESTIEKQESELKTLRQHMVKYLLSHPDVQQAYLKRLQALEVSGQSGAVFRYSVPQASVLCSSGLIGFPR